MKNTDTLYKKMFCLVLPIAFQQFMLALVSACDAIMLGKLNQNSMSAVSLASQVTFVFNLFMAAFLIGENMFVAQYYGKKDYGNISKIVGLVLRISCLVAICFSIGSILFPNVIMRFFTNDADLARMGCEYLRNVGISYVLSAMAQVYLTLMKNCDAVNLSTLISSIMGHLGTDAVAANSIANISKNLVVCLCLGFGSAGSIIVGNELGANHLEDAKKAGRTLTIGSILCGVLSGLVLLALSPAITNLVSLTPGAREYLKGMLIISSYYLVGKSINSMTIGGIFPAGGDSRFGLVCDAVTLWCITIPPGYLCAFILKLPILAVYFVLNLDEIIKLPVVYRHYKKYGWVNCLTQ
jgi:Na+-driven multidrug efflux pump